MRAWANGGDPSHAVVCYIIGKIERDALMDLANINRILAFKITCDHTRTATIIYPL